jgi:hypothetical protein
LTRRHFSGEYHEILLSEPLGSEIAALNHAGKEGRELVAITINDTRI